MKKLIEEVKAKGIKDMFKEYLKNRFNATEKGFPVWMFWDHRSGRGGRAVLIIISFVIGLCVPAWMRYAMGVLEYIW